MKAILNYLILTLLWSCIILLGVIAFVFFLPAIVSVICSYGIVLIFENSRLGKDLQ